MEKKRLCSYESPSEGKIVKNLDYDASIDRMNRIMVFYSMSQLLQPRHNYFIDKQATIIDWAGFRQLEHKKMLCYPKLGGLPGESLPRKNPYRKYQLARSHTGRVIKMMIDLIEKFHLTGTRLAFMTLTMPKELSVWLSYQKHGRDIAWRMFKQFWEWYEDYFGPGLAAHVNLHTWRSEIPLEPHYHYHLLIPNYKRLETKILDDYGDNSYGFERQEWHRQRGGAYVPVSEKDLEMIKMVWWKIVSRLCNRKKVSWYGLENESYSKILDVHFQYATWEEAKEEFLGKVKLMHWFNYQGRYTLEDYAKYSNEHLDCPEPPLWLTDYENHSRAFGWWKLMRKLVPEKKEEKVKINPVTGGKMEFVGRFTLYELLDKGKIGFLEVIRGNPIFHRLKGKELAWLLSVQRELHPGIKRANMYDTQAGDMEEI